MPASSNNKAAASRHHDLTARASSSPCLSQAAGPGPSEEEDTMLVIGASPSLSFRKVWLQCVDFTLGGATCQGTDLDRPLQLCSYELFTLG